MASWIALFRGINVGGHRVLPMKELKSLLEGAGCQGVATYIQSGNVVFRHAESSSGKLSKMLRNLVNESFDFTPEVLVLKFREIESAVAGNPFQAAVTDPKTMHLWFLAEKPLHPDTDALTALRSGDEEFELRDAVFYLHAPDGIGRSKLAAKVEKLLGVSATARNWRTVNRILEMAAGTG